MNLRRPRVISSRDVAIYQNQSAIGNLESTPNQSNIQSQASEGSYLAKVVTYIPAEVVGVYVMITGAMEQGKDTIPLNALLWFTFLTLLILTPIWILITTRRPELPPAYYQSFVSAIAFAAWVFALGGPFESLMWYEPIYGTVVLALLAGLIIPLGEQLFLPRGDERDTITNKV